jgi:transcriptional regulator with XRE-family HTH domain
MAETLGSLLSGARSRLGWSLRDTERATGVPGAHLSQLETGKILRPGIAVLAKLSKAYEIPLRQLVTAAGRGGDWELTGDEDTVRASERERVLSALRGRTVLMQPAIGPEVAAVPFAAVLDVLRGDDA